MTVLPAMPESLRGNTRRDGQIGPLTAERPGAGLRARSG
jgi:hypothetical protein